MSTGNTGLSESQDVIKRLCSLVGPETVTNCLGVFEFCERFAVWDERRKKTIMTVNDQKYLFMYILMSLCDSRRMFKVIAEKFEMTLSRTGPAGKDTDLLQ